ncbi:cellulose biosynthesis cyclic di-GMP-binding regulatory protein BcsB [Clostridium sp.]|uniref:cellulose biosynthesis cyclic di-GMP-binding regulatory protein BcsB n=1 Tax=Clostridium sp. TaxID=1506 RepID=UPI0025C3AD07|nr:cellulose biosynthesis cyclic di-GMP-binding regulatory protein BcsB [Clostridium sp.]
MTYPQPFVSNRKLDNTALVVPESLSENEVEGISRMFLYMGKDIDYSTGNIEVLTDKNFSEKYHDMNLILYGTPENNQIIKKMNSKLWFKYNKKYTSFTGNEKLYLTDPYASNISVFQFDISPYNNSKSVLVLTSPKKDLLLKSLVFLSSPNHFLKLSGDSILIDSFGNIKSFQFKKENTESTYDKLSSMDTETKTFTLFAALLLAFGIAAILLYRFKNRRFR